MNELLKLINILGFSNKSSNSGLYYKFDFDNKFYEITITPNVIFFDFGDIDNIIGKYWLINKDIGICECTEFIKNHFKSYLRKNKINNLING